jgi:hypothetical protein
MADDYGSALIPRWYWHSTSCTPIGTCTTRCHFNFPFQKQALLHQDGAFPIQSWRQTMRMGGMFVASQHHSENKIITQKRFT